MATKRSVVVSLNVEGFSGHATDEVTIERAQWDALTVDGRNELLDELAGEHAANYVGWGWHIADSDDMAGVIDQS